MQDKDVQKIVTALKKEKSVIAVVLFGSHATGKNGPMSDIDLAIFLKPYDKETALMLGAYSSPRIDTVIFNDLPPYIKFEIVREGKSLFVRDQETFDWMAVMAMKEYHDYVPFYERQGLLKVKA